MAPTSMLGNLSSLFVILLLTRRALQVEGLCGQQQIDSWVQYEWRDIEKDVICSVLVYDLKNCSKAPIELSIDIGAVEIDDNPCEGFEFSRCTFTNLTQSCIRNEGTELRWDTVDFNLTCVPPSKYREPSSEKKSVGEQEDMFLLASDPFKCAPPQLPSLDLSINVGSVDVPSISVFEFYVILSGGGSEQLSTNIGLAIIVLGVLSAIKRQVSPSSEGDIGSNRSRIPLRGRTPYATKTNILNVLRSTTDCNTVMLTAISTMIVLVIFGSYVAKVVSFHFEKNKLTEVEARQETNAKLLNRLLIKNVCEIEDFPVRAKNLKCDVFTLGSDMEHAILCLSGFRLQRGFDLWVQEDGVDNDGIGLARRLRADENTATEEQVRLEEQVQVIQDCIAKRCTSPESFNQCNDAEINERVEMIWRWGISFHLHSELQSTESAVKIVEENTLVNVIYLVAVILIVKVLAQAILLWSWILLKKQISVESIIRHNLVSVLFALMIPVSCKMASAPTSVSKRKVKNVWIAKDGPKLLLIKLMYDNTTESATTIHTDFLDFVDVQGRDMANNKIFTAFEGSVRSNVELCALLILANSSSLNVLIKACKHELKDAGTEFDLNKHVQAGQLCFNTGIPVEGLISIEGNIRVLHSLRRISKPSNDAIHISETEIQNSLPRKNIEPNKIYRVGCP